PWRHAILGTAATLALVVLLLELFLGFGLEAAVAQIADAKLERDRAQATTPEELQKFEIKRGMEIGQYAVARTRWCRLAVFCQLIAVASTGLGVWLERRGDRPPPQVQI